MTILLNDRHVELPEGATLVDALTASGLPEKGVATALNNDVVPVAERAATQLTDGDKVLVIKAFYGG